MRDKSHFVLSTGRMSDGKAKTYSFRSNKYVRRMHVTCVCYTRVRRQMFFKIFF